MFRSCGLESFCSAENIATKICDINRLNFVVPNNFCLVNYIDIFMQFLIPEVLTESSIF